MGQDTVTIGQLDPKHGIGQQLEDSAFYFNCVFARHVRISGSSLLIKTVCSKCAEGIPSAVRTVQPSSSKRTAAVPQIIIGSIASGIPALSRGPLPPLPQFGILGFSGRLRPPPRPTNPRPP